jgi:hypothetical protein
MVIVIPSETQTCPDGNPRCRKIYNRTIGVGAAIGTAALSVATVGAALTKGPIKHRGALVAGGAVLTALTAHETYSRFKK